MRGKRSAGAVGMVALALALASVATSVVCFAAPGAASETPSPVVLDWRAPASCPDSSAVTDEIGRMLGGFDGGVERTVHARALVSRTAHWGWVLLLTTDTELAHGERAIQADSCDALAGAAALVLTLAVDPSRAELGIDAVGDGGGPAVNRASAPSDAGARPSEKRAAVVPPPPVPTSTPHLAAISLAPTLDFGTLPSPALGGTLAAAWTPPHARVEATASLWASERAPLVTSAQQGGLFHSWSVGGRACHSTSIQRVDVGPCGVVDVESMSASGYGTTADATATATWVALGLGGFGAVALTHELAVRLSLEAMLPITPPQFFIYNSDGTTQTVHQPAAVSARASFGLEVRFF